MDVERLVMTEASRNGGIIGRAEAVAMGMSPRTIDRRIATGHLTVVGKGLLCLPGVFHHERSLLRAATLALGAVASHESAARLHQLTGLDPRNIAVSVPIRRSNRFEGLRVHQLTDIGPEQVVELDGIPTTVPTRTMIDLAAVLPERKLTEVLDEVVRRRLSSYEDVLAELERLARRGKPGVRKLRRVLGVRLGFAIVSDSTLKTRLLELIERGGLPTPSTQFRPPWLRRIGGRVDLAFIDQRVQVEGDSLTWHGSPEAFQTDRRRDNLAQLAGWVILRFTWEDMTRRPDYVVATIRHALDRSVSDSRHM